MYDIFFYEAFAEEDQAIKTHLSPAIQAGFTWKTIQELGESSPPAKFISTRTQSIFPWCWASQLSAILTRSTGYDHIHRYWQHSSITVPAGYLPLYCHRAVAEQAMLLWMALLRKLPQQMQQFQIFHRDGLTGQESEGKTLLVVGVGHIGYEIIKLGQALGMTVTGVDLVEKYPDVFYLKLEIALAQADIIVCAMNLTTDNVGYFHYELFKQAKPGVIFINIARGELSPMADLHRLLEERWLGGVGLDVYEQETELAVTLRQREIPQTTTALLTMELSKFPNVILTPHNAFNTQEALARKSQHTVLQVHQFLERGKFWWTVPHSYY